MVSKKTQTPTPEDEAEASTDTGWPAPEPGTAPDAQGFYNPDPPGRPRGGSGYQYVAANARQKFLNQSTSVYVANQESPIPKDEA